MEDNPMTHDLRRDLREACLCRDDAKAFEILQKINQLDAEDIDAQEQMKETGKRLCEAHAHELKEAAGEENMTPIRQIVAKFRNWAAENELRKLDGWSALARRVDEEAKEKHTNALKRMLNLVGITKDTEARNKMADEAERFATQHNLEFSDKELELIHSAHQEWEQECAARRHAQEIEEADDEITAMRFGFSRNRRNTSTPQLFEQKAALIAIIGRLTGELADADPQILKRAQRLQTLLEGELTLRHRKQVVLRTLSGACTLSILAALSFTGYLYSTVADATKELVDVRQAKHMGVAKELAEHALMPKCYTLIDEKYAGEYRNFTKWYQGYNRCINTFRTLKQKVDRHPTITADNMSEYIASLDKLVLAANQAATDYGENLWENKELQMKELLAPIEQCVTTLIDTYSHSSADTPVPEIIAHIDTLDRLQKIGADFGESCGFDTKQLTEAYNQQLNILHAQLLIMAEKSLDNASDCYERYRVTYHLPDEWGKELEARRDTRSQLRTLANCRDYADYVRRMEQIQSAYVPEGCCSIEQLKAIQQNGRDALIRSWLKSNTDGIVISDAEAQDVTALLRQLKLVQEVYRQGANIYNGNYTNRASAIVDKFDEPLFKDVNRKIAIIDFKGREYVGAYYKMGADIYLESMEKDDPTGKKLKFPGSATVQKVSTKFDIEKMRLSKSALEHGVLTPPELLTRIASYKSDALPTYVKVYYSMLALDWADALHDAILSGKELSPSFRKHVQHIKRLAAQNSTDKYCWYDTHTSANIKEWKVLFSQICSTDYRREILTNAQRVSNIKLQFCGYINENAKPIMPQTESAQAVYFRFENGEPVVSPYRGEVLPAFTPLFSSPQ